VRRAQHILPALDIRPVGQDEALYCRVKAATSLEQPPVYPASFVGL
jgi:hypothetical protein